MTLPERITEDEDAQLDRRKLSTRSKQEWAEYIEHGDTDAAFRKLYRVFTGDRVSDHPPTREVVVSVGMGVSLADNERVGLEVTVGNETRTVFVPDTGSDVGFGLIEDGTYSLSATATVLREYGSDGLDSTETTIEDSTMTLDDNITVDTESTDYDTTTTGSITVNSITLGGGK